MTALLVAAAGVCAAITARIEQLTDYLDGLLGTEAPGPTFSNSVTWSEYPQGVNYLDDSEAWWAEQRRQRALLANHFYGDPTEGLDVDKAIQALELQFPRSAP